jgi:hypothetical protein
MHVSHYLLPCLSFFSLLISWGGCFHCSNKINRSASNHFYHDVVGCDRFHCSYAKQKIDVTTVTKGSHISLYMQPPTALAQEATANTLWLSTSGLSNSSQTLFHNSGSNQDPFILVLL